MRGLGWFGVLAGGFDKYKNMFAYFFVTYTWGVGSGGEAY